MSARRDALLFFAMALVPSLAIGLLGERAIRNEGAARERELTVSAAQAATSLARRIQDDVREHGERLRSTSVAEGAPLDVLYERAREAAPDFAEPIVVASDGSIVLPRGTPATASDAVNAACDERAADLWRAPTPALREELLEECLEARDGAGRWLWPVLAFESLSRSANDALVERLLAWLADHADRMSREEVALSHADAAALEPFRAGLSAAVGRALSGDASRARGDLGAIQGAERSTAFRVAVRAVTLSPGSVESFSGDGQLGSLAGAGAPAAYGFVVNRESILREARVLGVADERFVATLARGRALELERNRGPESRATIADGLEVLVRLRDPDAIARDRRRTELVLYGLLTMGMGLAVVLAFALFRRMQETRRTSELRTSFVAGVSHELRTPLASIRMLSELLAEGRVDDSERREVLDALTDEAVRLTTTVERFLAYAKSERGKLVAEKVAGDLGAVVIERVAAFRERTGSSVELDIDDASKEAASGLLFDRRQLEIVVDNLLANASKYAPQGQPYAVELRATPTSVSLSVSDGGPGVDAATEKRIFKAFERGDDRLSAAVSGTGLGLFLVRTIADAHRGHVRVERSARGGARFTVTLPGRGS